MRVEGSFLRKNREGTGARGQAGVVVWGRQWEHRSLWLAGGGMLFYHLSWAGVSEPKGHVSQGQKHPAYLIAWGERQSGVGLRKFWLPRMPGARDAT